MGSASYTVEVGGSIPPAPTSAILVHSYSSGFYDPQFVPKLACFKPCEEIPKARVDRFGRGIVRRLEYHDSAAFFRREAQDVAEVVIQRDEHAALRNRGGENGGVGGSAQPLFENGRYVVTFRVK